MPPIAFIVNGDEEVTIDTQLPANYRIDDLTSLHGTAEADGTTLRYRAPSSATADTLYISYYEGSRIKGYTQMYFMSGLNGDVNNDGKISIADITAMVGIILGKENVASSTRKYAAADLNRDAKASIADVTALVKVILEK